MTFWNGVLWLHLLAMAFFVGGQLMLAAIVVPVLRRVDDDRVALRAAARRFGIGTLAAVGVLVITGAAMASHLDRWSDSTLQVKLGLVVWWGCWCSPTCAVPPGTCWTPRSSCARSRSCGLESSLPGSRAPWD